MPNILGKPVHDLLAVRLATKRKTVDDTPILVCCGSDNLPLRKLVRIYNTSTTETVYYADTIADATVANGCPILPGEIETLAVTAEVDLFLITDGTDVSVVIQEGY